MDNDVAPRRAFSNEDVSDKFIVDLHAVLRGIANGTFLWEFLNVCRMD